MPGNNSHDSSDYVFAPTCLRRSYALSFRQCLTEALTYHRYTIWGQITLDLESFSVFDYGY